MKKIEKMEWIVAVIVLASIVAFFVDLLATIWLGEAGFEVSVCAFVVLTACTWLNKMLCKAKKNLREAKQGGAGK